MRHTLAIFIAVLSWQFAGAATVALGTSGVDPNNYSTFSGITLQSVTLGGTTFSTTNLVQITLTGFSGGNAGALLVSDTGQGINTNLTRSAQQRRDLIETDWRADTGIINPANTVASYQASFKQAVINRLGIDMILYEINPSPSADGFKLTIGANSLTVAGTSYGDTGADTPNADVVSIRNPENTGFQTPSNITILLGNPIQVTSIDIAQNVYGIGIDFSDLGVALGASVTSFSLESTSSSFFDPVIIAGVVPEPSSCVLLGLGLGALCSLRRRG